MKPMEIRQECYACLERLVALTVQLATPDAARQQEARQAAMAIVDQDFGPGAIPACIANRFHRVVQSITGNPDPFASRKAAETAYLAKISPKIVPTSGADLESLVRLAVSGNAIDFFRAEAEVSREISGGVTLVKNDLADLQALLSQEPRLLLYLADNAGEQFFDQPLVAYLRRLGWQALYVVKGGPVQNDLTRDDLYASGLGEALEPVVDTGAKTVGLVLEETRADFQELFQAASLILAKGMGHFETLGNRRDPRLFFLLQAKCHPVAQALEVPLGGFVLVRRCQ